MSEPEAGCADCTPEGNHPCRAGCREAAAQRDCDDRLELGSFIVLCSEPRGHYQTHHYATTADDGRSVSLEWDKARCSSCGQETDTRGCVPGPDGPSHTVAGNGGRPCAQAGASSIARSPGV